MSVIANENARLGWLLGRLANRRNHILDLVRRLTGFGPPSSLNPSLFAKFLHMLDDVAAASKEEAGLIGRIEDIEQKHLVMRRSKRLKHAGPISKTTFVAANEDKPETGEKPSSHRLLKLAVFWYLFMRQKINQKKQGLTAD